MTADDVTVLVVAVPQLAGLLERHESKPEYVARLLEAHLALAAHTLEAGGGRIEPFTFGGLTAVFGLDGSAGVHERAVAAGVMLIGANERLNLDQPGSQVDIAIGIAAGTVVAGTNDAPPWVPRLLGDCIHVAARLAAHARPSEVVMTERVYESVASTVRAKANRPQSILGREAQIVSFTLKPAVLKQLH